jgi:Glycosyl transferase family 2
VTDSLRVKAFVRSPAIHRDGSPAVVSVIIPCYNYGRFLPDSIGSALAQSGVAPQVIIVDDASTDDSADIAERWAVAEPSVSVIRCTENVGHVAAFNKGLSAATGEYVVRLDADDLLAPGALQRAVALFEAFPSVGLVYGHPRHFTTAEPPPARGGAVRWRVWSGEDWIAERCRKGVNCITTPEAVVRGSVLRRVGGLDTRLRFAQDMEMWLRVAAVSDVARVVGPDQALHRDHAGSMSVTTGSGYLLDLRERRTVFEVLFAGPGRGLASADQLENTARQALATEALRQVCHTYDRGRFHAAEAAELVDMALAMWPQADRSPQWRALHRRELVGSEWSRFVPAFVASAAWRRARNEYQHFRWQRTGV